MRITIEKNLQISTVDQWFQVAPPKGESSQWRPGRSAMEMARFALSDKFPTFIANIIRDIGDQEDYFTCEPEAKTSFSKGMGTSGPRNHDLLMIGSSMVIGLEAKVSEPFDKQIKAKRIGATDNMKCRLNACLDYLYGENNHPGNAEDLYYQLFSATIGTILEAERNKKKKALVLFITFNGDVDKEPQYADHIQANDEAFKSFCTSLGLSEKGGKLSSIPGAKDKDLECWIKGVKVTIGDYQIH